MVSTAVIFMVGTLRQRDPNYLAEPLAIVNIIVDNIQSWDVDCALPYLGR